MDFKSDRICNIRLSPLYNLQPIWNYEISEDNTHVSNIVKLQRIIANLIVSTRNVAILSFLIYTPSI